MSNKEKILPLLGLCRRAGGTVTGLGSFLTEVKSKKKIVMVLLASDASERTKKQVRDKSRFYEITLFESDIDSASLGHALGCVSSVGVVALNGRGPVKGITEIINKDESIER